MVIFLLQRVQSASVVPEGKVKSMHLSMCCSLFMLHVFSYDFPRLEVSLHLCLKWPVVKDLHAEEFRNHKFMLQALDAKIKVGMREANVFLSLSLFFPGKCGYGDECTDRNAANSNAHRHILTQAVRMRQSKFEKQEWETGRMNAM